jgi:hypothetical protein
MPIGDAALRLRNQVAAAAAGRHATLDDRFEALASEIPGFGGMYYDSTGKLTVLLKDARRVDAARPPVAAFLRGNSRRHTRASLADRAANEMRVKPARYEFRLLRAWYRTFVIPATHDNPGVVLSAIQHRTNRIVIGVKSAELVQPTLAILGRLPMPRSAYEVKVFGLGEETLALVDTSLTAEFRPGFPGGVQVARATGGGQIGCSLGFNLVDWLTSSTTDTTRYFITAAHCTTAMGSVATPDWFGQPDYTDSGGSEIIDPPSFTSFQSANCPPSATCYLSDAAVLRHGAASQSQHGKIAWPSSNNSLLVNGGRLEVEDMEDPIEGQAVYKVGGTTGRTFGYVEYPCVLLTKLDGTKFICQGLATYYSDEGDSGGPVFRLTSSTTAIALGTAYYRFEYPENVWNGVFSPMSGIVNYSYYSGGGYLFDPSTGTSAPAVPPPPSPPSYYASISGPEVVGPFMFCTWYSGTNIDDPSYEWFADGISVGTDPSLVRVSNSSFLLELHVWNPLTGADRWDSLEVTVDQNAASCQ